MPYGGYEFVYDFLDFIHDRTIAGVWSVRMPVQYARRLFV